MMYRAEHIPGQKAYVQLYEQLRQEIVAGVFACGARLPSKRLLAEEAGVSLSTVEHAYALLCDEGYAEARERSGFFAAFRAESGFSLPEPAGIVLPEKTAEREQECVFPFGVLSRAMRSVLTAYGEAILIKAPARGCDALRTALSRYLRRSRGIDARPEQIVIGAGAEYLYSQIVRLLGHGRTYALEEPSYEKIEQVYRAEGVRCDMLPLGRDGIISEALRRTEATVLHVTPYRSFPSGVTASASKRHEYLRWTSQGDRYLVEDDFESEFSVAGKPEETLFALDGGRRVIYLNTFSKTVSPALRVGYMVLPEALSELYGERAGFFSCTVPAFEQYVLAQLMENGDFERHINRVRRQKRRRLQELTRGTL